jgi:hypothetical protein
VDGEAVTYLKLTLAEQNNTDDMIRLANELGGVSLALIEAAEFIEENGMALREYLELLGREKAKDVDTAMRFGGRHDTETWSRLNARSPTMADLERAVMNWPTVPSTDRSRTAQDPGYGPYKSVKVATADNGEQDKPSGVILFKAVSSFIDLGLEGRLKGINIFASELVQSLSPDIPGVSEGREFVVAVVQLALRAYSYSLEQRTRPERGSDERKAAQFIWQQSQYVVDTFPWQHDHA